MERLLRPARRGGARDGVIALVAILAATNVAAWIALFAAAHRFALLLPLGITAYVLGLRHAVDPDHIAAIDGTTRKLLHRGRRAEAVGLYFSLGHSTIVFALSIVLAIFGVQLKAHVPALQTSGLLLGTWISAIFLIVVALGNAAVFFDVARNESGGDAFPAGGLLARILRPALDAVNSSPQMYLVGLLFGLGFDTATEVALLGISAASGAGGMPVAFVLLLPWLFTAGMSLVDSLEGLAMLGAYGWAYVHPGRKRFYNLSTTLLTVAIALFVSVAEIGSALGFGSLAFPSLGYGIVAIFGANVAVSALIYRPIMRARTKR